MDVPVSMVRRHWLLQTGMVAALPSDLLASSAHGAAIRAAQPRELAFPRDFGAHLNTRIEWWYVTGALQTDTSRELGFQITFFRSLVPPAEGRSTQNVDPSTGSSAPRSRLRAAHLLFAHAALTDTAAGRLVHAERLARWNGLEDTRAAQAASLWDTDVRIGPWRLWREQVAQPEHTWPSTTYRARWGDTNAGFAFDLKLRTTQPLLLQGEDGYSRKSPLPGHASHYYSQPQLAVDGHLQQGNRRERVQGRAWLDHEWSDAILDPQAVGWDWVGLNLDDGGALTVFRLRRADGSTQWAGGSFHPAGGTVRAFSPQEVRMVPAREWRSPATGARYPVEWTLHTPAGVHMVRARIDAQELDSRSSTGTVYWEGLSSVHDAQGRPIGKGYLEMTGYAARLTL